jgi:MazG family protein
VPHSPADDRTRRDAGDALLALADVMTRLRAPDGCPWDAEQDLHTLRRYLVEEAHEVLEVIDQLSPAGEGDWEAHRDELGDLLLQVVFQSEIQREAGRFDLGDVAQAIHDKLVRRHPHVFEGKERKPGDWERIKAEERAAKGKAHTSALDGVPAGLPALMRAYQLGKKANAVGFDWPDTGGVVDKIKEELGEVEEALASGNKERFSEEVGDLLYAIVNLSRHVGIDPEAALRGTMRRFQDRFAIVEEGLRAEGRQAKGTALDELEARWQAAKRQLKDAAEG